VLSARFTDQPQVWASVPAACMGLGGLLLQVFGSSVDSALGCVWPPWRCSPLPLDDDA
jgi:cytochrome c oxidase assembly factor CtaG